MTTSDLEMVLNWRNHPDVSRYMYTKSLISVEEHRRWFSEASKRRDVELLIYERMGSPEGFVNITLVNSSRWAKWGFYLSPGSQMGNGLRLGGLALAYAFSELNLLKLCGEVIDTNERSISFHKKLGFTEEGRKRDHWFDGKRFHDVVCFGLYNYEWRGSERSER